MEEKENKFRTETYVLIMAFFFLPLDALFSVAHLGKDVTPAKMLVLGAFCIFLLRCLLTKNLTKLLVPFRRPVTIILLLYLLISFLSTMNSRFVIEPAFQEPIFVAFRRVSFFVLYYSIIAIACNFKALQSLVLALVLASTLSCLAGVYEIVMNKAFLVVPQSVHGTELMKTPTGSVRISGLELVAGLQAVLLAMLLPFLLRLFFLAKRRIIGIAASVLLLLYLVNIIGSGSRSGWMGMLIAVSVYLFFSSRPRRRLLYLAGSALAVILVFVSLSLFTDTATVERFGIGKGESGSRSVGHRKTMMEMALRTARDYPLLGIGTGNSINAQHHYGTITLAALPRNIPNDPHNGYLQVLAENGSVGLLVFCVLLLLVMREILLLLKVTSSRRFHSIACACLASFAAALWLLALYPLLDNKYFWAIVGLCVACSNVFSLAAREESSLSAI